MNQGVCWMSRRARASSCLDCGFADIYEGDPQILRVNPSVRRIVEGEERRLDLLLMTGEGWAEEISSRVNGNGHRFCSPAELLFFGSSFEELLIGGRLSAITTIVDANMVPYICTNEDRLIVKTRTLVLPFTSGWGFLTVPV